MLSRGWEEAWFKHAEAGRLSHPVVALLRKWGGGPLWEEGLGTKLPPCSWPLPAGHAVGAARTVSLKGLASLLPATDVRRGEGRGNLLSFSPKGEEIETVVHDGKREVRGCRTLSEGGG